MYKQPNGRPSGHYGGYAQQNGNNNQYQPQNNGHHAMNQYNQYQPQQQQQHQYNQYNIMYQYNINIIIIL